MNFDELIRKNFVFRTPDLTFLLDASPKVCMERLYRRGNDRTRFENEEKMVAARTQFLYLTEMFPDQIALINGELKIDEVADKIQTIIIMRNLI